jgi:serine protease Do
MFHKSIVITCLLAGGILAVAAQTTAPKAGGESRSFSWTFSSEGGYLGIETVEVSNENFAKYGLPSVRGVAVEKVVEGAPAEKAGLQSGDVIVRMNGDEITSTRKLTRLIGEIAPDHAARVTVFRGGSERELSVTVGKRPMPGFDAVAFGRLGQIPDFPMAPDAPLVEGLPRVPREPGKPMVWAFGNRRQIGIGTTSLTKQLAEHFGVESGVMVSGVREDSPAAKAGLKAGDIIVEANGKAVKGDGDLIRAIAEKKEGDVSVTFVRDRIRQTVSVTPEEVKGGFDTYFEFPKAPTAPGAPGTPGLDRMPRPAVPATPIPLGQIGFPRRVI